MVNYKLGKIYKIVCNITDEIYIGSTCQPTLAHRLTKHVSDYKQFLKGNKTGKYKSFDIIGRGDYQILLIEAFPCNSKDEMTAREGEIIRSYKLECGCLNLQIPGRSKKEYQKQHREKNKDEISKKRKEKTTCVCGSCVRRVDKAQHERSKKHIDFITKELLVMGSIL